MVIKGHNSFEYRTIYDVLEWRNGAVFRTKFKGYAHRDRPLGLNETSSSLSTNVTHPRHHAPDGTIKLEPFLES